MIEPFYPYARNLSFGVGVNLFFRRFTFEIRLSRRRWPNQGENNQKECEINRTYVDYTRRWGKRQGPRTNRFPSRCERKRGNPFRSIEIASSTDFASESRLPAVGRQRQLFLGLGRG